MSIKRIFVSKRRENRSQDNSLKFDLQTQLSIEVEDLIIWKRYDVEGLDEESFETCVTSVFSEPPVDNVVLESLPLDSKYQLIAVELLPGQFDQRADSCEQCIQLLTKKERPTVRYATVYQIATDAKNVKALVKYLVNPVEARVASLIKPESLELKLTSAQETRVLVGLNKYNDKKIAGFVRKGNFAMSAADMCLVRDWFSKEGRDPNELEIKVVDTYWSDHCRHTTFLTQLDTAEVTSQNPHIEDALNEYNGAFKDLYANRPDKYSCLMDIATIAAKVLKKKGLLKELDESEEINACSINVKANINGQLEDWLVMFKNETHNHPTEIEPFGGAATCLGGAIRDPLSGRSYVYQAMRITGAADPRTAFSRTLKGKLPQRVISKTATAGFSSYGNQIGLATGIVNEIYHPNFVAKRLETGFVVAAAPKKNVIRKVPAKDDIIVLIGGETGRDGCGGATGSSKAHSKKSVETCGAEVQKGNAPTERKLQRLFRNASFTKLVKRCNDFGAGGICVAIGELSPGLVIELDKVPKKYEGLTATELAISESQERMAVVINPKDLEKVEKLAGAENLAATHVATVTDDGRMRMTLHGVEVCNLSREMLDSNGAKVHATAEISDKTTAYVNTPVLGLDKFIRRGDYGIALEKAISSLNACSQKGMGEIFDSSIGASTVLSPFGGKSQLVPAISMAAKLPLDEGDTTTTTVASYGYDPELMSISPFMGAVYSIVDSVTKVVASGAPYSTIYLTLQEFFLRLNSDPRRWGIPTSALLGAMHAQLKLEIAAIGGKDSMSGTFENIDVPPTLISFALGITDADKVTVNVLDRHQVELFLIDIPRDNYGMIEFDVYKTAMKVLSEEIQKKNVTFATTVGNIGVAGAIAKSLLGSNELGFDFKEPSRELFCPKYGNIIIATKKSEVFEKAGIPLVSLGKTTRGGKIAFGSNSSIAVSDVKNAFTQTLESIYPTVSKTGKSACSVCGDSFEKQSNSQDGIAVVPTNTATEIVTISSQVRKTTKYSGIKIAKPRVLIPVFPGTNCEYDTARAFRKAGAEVEMLVVKNLSSNDVESSVRALTKAIKNSQIIAFAGGFSGGDEPDGSGKLIATTFRNPSIATACRELMAKRDGLMIGICNGFQVLMKLGLLPQGDICELKEDSPTLTFNDISRHVATISRTRVTSVISPWLSGCKVGQVFGVPVSHGEGKFVCTKEDYEKMLENNQIFSQYVDDSALASMVSPYNPNGSMYAIEGITSPDGRILGKMGHIERLSSNCYKNIDEEFDMKIFDSGVRYFE